MGFRSSQKTALKCRLVESVADMSLTVLYASRCKQGGQIAERAFPVKLASKNQLPH
jgi:hypothetical protein